MRAKSILFLSVCLPTIFFSCTKKDSVGVNADNIPTIPVTVQNAMAYRPEATVSTSKAAGGSIQIILSIPAESGHTIKEITKVAAGTTYTQIQSSGSTGFYNTAPIAGSGTTVTFNTTIAEYIAKAGAPNPNPPLSNAELPKKFYFLVTLDDGTVIVTNSVRVLVLD
jgi:hypothetical protein